MRLDDLDLLDAEYVGFDPMDLVRALPGALKGTGQIVQVEEDKKAAAKKAAEDAKKGTGVKEDDVKSSASTALSATQQQAAESMGKKIGRTMLACSVLAAAGLGYGWRSHRILGALLGGFVVGPAVGVGVAPLFVQDEAKQLRKG